MKNFPEFSYYESYCFHYIDIKYLKVLIKRKYLKKICYEKMNDKHLIQ